MKKLYVFNSPSYVEDHPSHTCGQTLNSDPLSEHYTYMYYNFIKFGLVEQVVIFPRKGPHDLYKDQIIDKIEVEKDKFITLNWDRENMVKIMNSDPGSYGYCFSEYEKCKELKNIFVMFNPVVLGTNTKNCLDKRYHHYSLLEGRNHQKYFRTVPLDIPEGISRTTCKKFTELDVDSIQRAYKKYDWIMISSFDPRKRHLEFLRSLSTHQKFKDLKGCIAARNPDNKGYLHAGHHVLNQIKQGNYQNVDIFFNVDNELKIDLLSKSKFFVNTSEFEYGPRAIVEAVQAGVPIFTMEQIGVADLVKPGVNGELINHISEVTQLYNAIEKYDHGQYFEGAKEAANSLRPEFIYPDLINDIKEKSKAFNEDLFQ
jgi:glycosyltransferase involved in cell wall biosynthesis